MSPSTPRWFVTITNYKSVIWNRQRTACSRSPSANSSSGTVISLYVGTWHAIFTWTSRVRHTPRLKSLILQSIKTSMLTVIRHGRTRCGQVSNTSVLHSITNRISRFLISFHSIYYLSLIGWMLMQTILHPILGYEEQVWTMEPLSEIPSQATVLWTSMVPSTLNDFIIIFRSSERPTNDSTELVLHVLSWLQNRRRLRGKWKKKKGRRKERMMTRRRHSLRTRRALKRKSLSMLTLLSLSHTVRIQNVSSFQLKTKEERL